MITPPVPVKPTTKAIPVRGAFKVVPKNIVAPKSIPKSGLREKPKIPRSTVIRYPAPTPKANDGVRVPP